MHGYVLSHDEYRAWKFGTAGRPSSPTKASSNDKAEQDKHVVHFRGTFPTMWCTNHGVHSSCNTHLITELVNSHLTAESPRVPSRLFHSTVNGWGLGTGLSSHFSVLLFRRQTVSVRHTRHTVSKDCHLTLFLLWRCPDSCPHAVLSCKASPIIT